MSLDHSDLHFEVTECAPVPCSLQWDRVARVLHDCDAGEVLVSPTSWLSKSTQPVLGRKPWLTSLAQWNWRAGPARAYFGWRSV